MSDIAAAGPTKVKRSYGKPRPKVPPFARFEGTSAWRKYHRRAREYARFLAAAAKPAVATSGH